METWTETVVQQKSSEPLCIYQPCIYVRSSTVHLVLYSTAFYPFLLCTNLQPNIRAYSNLKNRSPASNSAGLLQEHRQSFIYYSHFCSTHASHRKLHASKFSKFLCCSYLPCFFFPNTWAQKYAVILVTTCARDFAGTNHGIIAIPNRHNMTEQASSAKEEWSQTCNNSINHQGLDIWVVSLTWGKTQ